MPSLMRHLTLLLAIVLHPIALGAQAPTPAPGQPPAAPGGRGGQAAQAPVFTSPEILPDRRIVFRLHAPDATSVTLRGGDVAEKGPATDVHHGDSTRHISTLRLPS